MMETGRKLSALEQNDVALMLRAVDGDLMAHHVIQEFTMEWADHIYLLMMESIGVESVDLATHL